MVNCVFYRDLLQWDELQTIVKALTGWDYSVEEMRSMANEIVTMTHDFNLREELGRASDTLPERLYRQKLPETGASITREELEYMLGDYYSIRGWA